MTNVSEMVCTYDWSFLEEETTSINKTDEEVKDKKKETPINEIFDILPVSGILREGETETVEFTYYAGHGKEYGGIAVCSVDGGPDYQVPLQGKSSFVSYQLSVKEIDFGQIPYFYPNSRDFHVENAGKVPFEFSVNLSTLTRPGILEVSPMTGKVMSGEKFKVSLKFRPGVPDNINEIFLVECAHFPAERFKIKAVGIYPGALLTFPRNDETFDARFEKTKKLMEKNKLKYDAKFSGKEIEVVPTGRGKQDKFQPDPYQMDVEAETDRIFLCEKLLEQEEISQAKNAVSQNDSKHNASMTMTRGGRTSPSKFPSADPDRSGAVDDEDKIFVTKYICDFGNIVVGQSKRKTFRLTNSGKSPLNFQFDQRVLQQIGLTIEPMRPPKPMAPNTSLQFTVVYSTRKNAKHGKVGYVVPINVQYGPSYNVEFVANLTIPEIAMSSDNVEFNKVCVGTRKIIKVRFENNKEVPCDWSYYFKESIQNAGASKEGDKFSVSPTSGYLLPGQKQTVDVIFTPTHEKVVTQKLQFKCNHNSKLFVLNTRGHGINYSLDVIENHIEMGPVLPYDKSSEKVIQLKNPMAFPIEVFSTDFDKQFIEEEDILKRYELLNNEKGDVIFETLRKAGSGFWQNIKEADELKRKYEDMQARIATIDETLENDFKTPEVEEGAEEGAEPEPLSEETIEKKKQLEEEKATLEQKISEIDSISKVEKAVIPKVKTRDRLNIILFGPEKSGKSTIAYFLSEEHQRGIVNLSELLSWCEKNNTPTYEEAAKYLEERDVECKAQEELEKKKKKKKDGEEEFDPRVYKFLPKEMLCKLIRERCDSEECNAGVIFDNIIGDHWKDEKSIIETICDALQEESVSLVTIGLNTVMDDGLEY